MAATKIGVDEVAATCVALAEQWPVGVVIVEADHCVYVNPAFVTMMGYSRAELLAATTVMDFVAEEDRAQVRDNLRRREQSQTPSITYSFRVRRKDGAPLDLEMFDSRILFEGRPAVMTTVLDVTARTRAAADLTAGDARYASLFANMLEGFAHCRMMTDARGEPQDFVYLAVNRRFEELTGLKDVVGKKVSDVIPGFRESNPEVMEVYGRVAATGTPERFETKVEALGMWLAIAAFSPGHEQFVAIFDNITARKEAEAGLKDAEERHRGIAASVNDIIIAIDRESRIINFANDAINRILGYDPAELIGKELTVLMPDRYRTLHRTGVKHYLDTGIKKLDWSGVRVFGRHKNGQEIPLEVSYSEYATATGRYIVGVMRDVSELRKQEDALRLFRTLIDRSNDIIEVVDAATGWILDVNETACAKLGYSREELLAMHVGDVDPTITADAFAEATEALRKAGFLLLTGRHRRKDGSEFPVEVSISHVQIDREYALAVVRDISERQRADRELVETRERLEQAVSAGAVGLWDWDLGTNRVTYSAEWKRQIGYAEDEISDGLDEWRDRVHPEDRDEAFRSVQQLHSRRPHFEIGFRIRHKDGSYRHVLSRGATALDAAGMPTRLLGAQVDISELKRLEVQLLQAQKMESVGRLAGGVAHDFNNLLSVINATADLAMSDMPLGDPLRADLEEIHRAGSRAAVLTRQLLAFSRQQIMRSAALNLNTVVAEMQGMFERVIGEDVDLAFVPGEIVGSVKADRGQIEQVIANLVVNARDAMPDGGRLTIETKDVDLDEAYAVTHPGSRPGPHTMLAISDTGMGMDETTCARIFEPFFTTKTEGKGTGLGLSTVYGIVKQSGGSIWVYSELGVGTAFKIYFPRVDELPSAVTPTVRSVTMATATQTILVVEDDDALREVVKRILRSAGYTVLAAASGAEAVQVMEHRDRPVHLLLTDVIMPGLNGRELAARLTRLEPMMSVIFTSGYTDDAVLRHGVLEEGTHFIGKPYSPAELTRKVREVLDEHGSRPTTG